MIITFLGHSSLCKHNLGEKLKSTILQNITPNESTIFYCGGYGDFDSLCVDVCRSVKKATINCEIVFITPYITESQQKKIKDWIYFKLYDSTIYPPLENFPPKFAICKRNEWMIDKADLVIAYVDHQYGGAYRSLNYARRKKKRIINLAENQI